MKLTHRILFIFLIFPLLILSSCKEPKMSIDLNSMNFDDLFENYISSSDSIIEHRMISLLQDSLIPECNWVIEIKESIDTINKTCAINYSRLDQENTETEWKGRGVISFFILDKGQIVFQREVLNSYDSLEDKVIISIVNPTDSWLLPKNDAKIINEDDTLRIPSWHIFVITTEQLGDSITCKTNWVDLKNVTKKVLFAYEIIRNDYSLKLYKSEFRNLSFDNRIKILEMIPIRIWVNINWQPPPPPPPPPPLPANTDNI